MLLVNADCLLSAFCCLLGEVFGATLGASAVKDCSVGVIPNLLSGISVFRSLSDDLLDLLLLDFLLLDFDLLDLESLSDAFADLELSSHAFNWMTSIALFIGNSALRGDNNMRENKHQRQ